MKKVLFVGEKKDDLQSIDGLEVLYAKNAHDGLIILNEYEIDLVLVESSVPFWDKVHDRFKGYIELVKHIMRPINIREHKIEIIVLCSKNCDGCEYNTVDKINLIEFVSDFLVQKNLA